MNILDKLLFNLHTISNIPTGKRISTAKEFIVIDEDSMLQGFWRWRAADSRDKAVRTVCNEIRTVIILSKYIMESVHLFIENESEQMNQSFEIMVNLAPKMNKREERLSDLKKIRLSLMNCNPGIDNLSRTYENDADVLGHLKPLIGEINECVSEITKTLLEFGEHVDMKVKHTVVNL